MWIDHIQLTAHLIGLQEVKTSLHLDYICTYFSYTEEKLMFFHDNYYYIFRRKKNIEAELLHYPLLRTDLSIHVFFKVSKHQ